VTTREELREALYNNDNSLKEVENQIVGSSVGVMTFLFLNALFSFRQPGWAQGLCIFMAAALFLALLIQLRDFHRLRIRRMDLQRQYREYRD